MLELNLKISSCNFEEVIDNPEDKQKKNIITIKFQLQTRVLKKSLLVVKFHSGIELQVVRRIEHYSATALIFSVCSCVGVIRIRDAIEHVYNWRHTRKLALFKLNPL